MMLGDLIISGIIIVFSLGLAVISILSYKKYRNQKLLFVFIVFILFLIKGSISVLSIFMEIIPEYDMFTYSGIIDLAVLILLYLATLKR